MKSEDEIFEDLADWIEKYLPEIEDRSKTNIRIFNEKPIPNGIPWRFYRMP